MSHHPRFPTTEARMSLANRFQLQYSSDMQDWEWEVADAQRFEEFLNAYPLQDMTEDERFSLMEMLVQCVEDMSQDASFVASWSLIKEILLSNPSLHFSTVEYWACLDTDAAETEQLFNVSTHMRNLLPVISSSVRSV